MNFFKITSLFGFALLCASCEKEIDVNVKNTNPTVVITGGIANTAGPHTIRVSRSVQLADASSFPQLQALVWVRDDRGNTDTFKAVSPGVYQSNSLTGELGRTYTLYVETEGTTYVANSTLPAEVPFDSLTIEGRAFIGDSSFYPEVHFIDPSGVPNYYRFVETVNGKSVPSIFVRSDRLSDGKSASVSLRDSDFELEPGDEATVEMQCIDERAYDYFNTLRTAGGSTNSAAPADPVTNLSNGALGYFSAYTSAIRKVRR